MDNNSVGRYISAVRETFSVGSLRVRWLVMTWFSYPVAVQAVLHSERSIQLANWLQGLPVPYAFTSRQLIAGELMALFALASLSLSMFIATVLIYRKAGFWFRLWPLVGIAVGFFGNLGWWIATRHFDPVGALAGFSPLSMSFVVFAICEKLGKEFVFPSGSARTQRI
jgi:hypothetical protein